MSLPRPVSVLFRATPVFACPASDERISFTILDTGATNHMFFSQKAFIPGSLRVSNSKVFLAAKKNFTRSTHTGDVLLRVSDEGGSRLLQLSGALLVPDVPMNIISVSRLDERGCCTTIANGRLAVSRAATAAPVLVAYKSKATNLYCVHAKYASVEDSSSFACLANSDAGLPEVDLLHRRLGHASLKYLQAVLPRLGKAKLSWCDACAQAKTQRKPFRHSPDVAENMQPLDKCCSDLCGPLDVESHLRRKRYFSVIIDVASRYTWVYFLRHKSDFPKALASWTALIKTQTGAPPKRFHADQGTEFTNKEAQKILETYGTRFTCSSTDEPNMNAPAERMNRTTLESALALMFQAGAPDNLWEQAVAYSVYLRNRTPHRHLGMRCPIEIFKLPQHQQQLSRGQLYKNIRIWGCEAFVHIPKNKRKKLSRKAHRCAFVGIDESGLFILYNLSTRKLVASRNVDFNESVFPWRDSPSTESDSEPDQRPDQSDDPDDPDSSSAPADVPRDDSWDADDSEDSDNNSPPAPVAVSTRSSPRGYTPSAQALRNLAALAASGLPSTPNTESFDPESDNDDAVSAAPRVTVPPTPASNSIQSHTALAAFRKFPRRRKNRDPDSPSTTRQANSRPDASHWAAARQTEVQDILHKNVWTIVPRSEAQGHTILTSRWIYTIKRKPDHTIDRYKARLTARGYNQVSGRDYGDTFAAVAKLKTFRILLALSAAFSLRVTQLDVQTAFLYADLEETIFLEHPESVPGPPDTVLRLLKNLYGLKQAPKAWWKKLVGEFVALGFEPCLTDPCLLRHQTQQFFVLLYVDDILLATADEAMRVQVTRALADKFQLKEFGDVGRYLNLQVEHRNGSFFLHQRSYIESVLEKFRMQDAKWAKTPGPDGVLSKSMCPSSDEERKEMAEVPYKSAVGSLLYASGGTRPDIAFAVNTCSQFSQDPGRLHWQAVKRILRYLTKTTEHAIEYRPQPDSSIKVDVFSDSDWGTNPDTRRSVTGYVVMIAGGPTIWQSKLQKTVALSSCEAELYALCEATKEIKWLVQLLKELRVPFTVPTLHVDNQGAIALSSNPVQHQRTKHIAIRWFFIREALQHEELKVVYVSTDDNLADIFTKAVTVGVHDHLLKFIMVIIHD